MMNKSRIYKLIFWLVMLVMAILFLAPQQFVSSGIFDWWDKAQHALAFGLLFLLGFIAYPQDFRKMTIGLIFYGVAIEIIQFWTGWRHGDVLDALADTVGVLFMGLMINVYQTYRVYRRN